MNIKFIIIFNFYIICTVRAQIENESSEFNSNSTSMEIHNGIDNISLESNETSSELNGINSSFELNGNLNETSLELVNETKSSSELNEIQVTTDEIIESILPTSTKLTQLPEILPTVVPISSSTTNPSVTTTEIGSISIENISDEFNPEKDIHFRLYNTQTYCQNVPEIILNNKESILSSNFNPTLPTRFLIHDWDTYSKSEFTMMIKDAYLSKSNHNIIIVNWEKASLAPYQLAQNNSIQVGQILGKFIDFLYKDGNLNLSDVYLIGFGLGAHIAGIAGRSIKNSDNQISVIYGLDPIQLRTIVFEKPSKLNTNRRHYYMKHLLSKSDAKYVEIIYTSQIISAILQEPAGHANFYVNLGTKQPGCDLNLSCGHARAYRYFAESIVASSSPKNEFIGIPCRSYRQIILGGICRRIQNPMGRMGGIVANRFNIGVFNVPVKSRPPHAIGFF